jgi:hypothetical protein
MSLLLALLHSLRVGEAALFLASVALQTRLAVAAPCGRPLVLTLRGGARRQHEQPKALKAAPPAPDAAPDGDAPAHAAAPAEQPQRADGAEAGAGTGAPRPPLLAPPPGPQPAPPAAPPVPAAPPARAPAPGAPLSLPFVPAVAAARALAGAGAAAAGSPAVAMAARALGGAVMHPALGAASALLLGVHLLAEGSRWQLLPLYVATGARTHAHTRTRIKCPT